jgi:hypothetical protein
MNSQKSTELKPCPACGGECSGLFQNNPLASSSNAVACVQCDYEVYANSRDEAVAIHNSISLGGPRWREATLTDEPSDIDRPSSKETIRMYEEGKR